MLYLKNKDYFLTFEKLIYKVNRFEVNLDGN